MHYKFMDSHKFLYPKYVTLACKVSKHVCFMCVCTCVQRGPGSPNQENHNVSTFSKEIFLEYENTPT